MVKIPELTKDGQNWKIYRTKVTATFDCLKVLAGRPYKEDDWDRCNALLCCTFMESVPPSIYFKICHRTTYENFKYLVKCFHNNNPTLCANELQRAGTATAAETPENYPTSMNTATEQLAMLIWTKKTYLLLKASNEARRASTAETLDAKTHTQA